jgi:hypothetical protein
MARNMLGRCREHGWGCVADEAAAARGLSAGGRSRGWTGGNTTTPTCWPPVAVSPRTRRTR